MKLETAEKIVRANVKLAAVFLIFSLLSAVFAGSATKTYAAGTGEGIIKRIEAKYANVSSISAYFYQKEVIPGYSQNMEVKGRFYYERSIKGTAKDTAKGTAVMAWVYEYPFHKRQVLRNGRLYIINDKDKKVTVIDVRRGRGGFPPNVIKVLGSITKYFSVQNVGENRNSGIITVELRPLSSQRAKRIYIGFYKKDLKIESLKIVTHQEQTIMFSYRFVKFNMYIKSRLFDVNFPPDYTVIDENQF